MARFLLQEGRQQLAAADLPLPGAEGVDQGPLHHPHEAQGAVGLDLLALGNPLEQLFQGRLKVAPERVQLHAAALQGPGGMGIVQEGQQEVLQGHILMAPRLGQLEGPLEALVQVRADLGGFRHPRPPR